MDNYGFVKLYREIIDWGWFTDVKTAHLFVYCILRANFKDTEWQGIMLKRGSFVTTLAHLAEKTGLTIKEVRSSLTRLERAQCLAKQTSRKYTIITVLNYDEYQSEGTDTGTQRAHKGHTEGKQRATDKKDKKDNKEKNISFDINDFSGSDFSAE